MKVHPDYERGFATGYQMSPEEAERIKDDLQKDNSIFAHGIRGGLWEQQEPQRRAEAERQAQTQQAAHDAFMEDAYGGNRHPLLTEEQKQEYAQFQQEMAQREKDAAEKKRLRGFVKETQQEGEAVMSEYEADKKRRRDEFIADLNQSSHREKERDRGHEH